MTAALGLIVLGSYIVGPIYWLYLSYQVGSFMMGLLGLFPLTTVFVGPIGLYSLIFGTPGWIYATFG